MTKVMKTTLKMNEKGPYILEGNFKVIDVNGNDITPTGGVARICRCGKSETKPFCDGCAHAKREAADAK